MLEKIVAGKKRQDQQKPAAEIGHVVALEPFAFTINGATYSADKFPVYVPAVDRIKQHDHIATDEHTQAFVDIGDLELEPDYYPRLFRVGDLIDVTDRGDSFIVHGRLVRA